VLTISLSLLVLVVGAKEQETRTVNIRNRDDPATQKMGELVPLQKVLERLVELRDERRLENKIDMTE
jgi:threonyl-tRNA synthetase